MKTRELDQEALKRTMMQMQRQRPYIPDAYIVSTVRGCLASGLEPITETGREVVRVYQQYLSPTGPYKVPLFWHHYALTVPITLSTGLDNDIRLNDKLDHQETEED